MGDPAMTERLGDLSRPKDRDSVRQKEAPHSLIFLDKNRTTKDRLSARDHHPCRVHVLPEPLQRGIRGRRRLASVQPGLQGCARETRSLGRRSRMGDLGVQRRHWGDPSGLQPAHHNRLDRRCGHSLTRMRAGERVREGLHTVLLIPEPLSSVCTVTKRGTYSGR